MNRVKCVIMLCLGFSIPAAFALESGTGKIKPTKVAEPASMQRKVSLDFVNTPVDEILSFMRSLANVTVIVDPPLLKRHLKISLKVKNMKIRKVFDLVAKRMGAVTYYREHAYYFSKHAFVEEHKTGPKPLPKLTKPQQAALQKALIRLGGEDFTVREAASKRILKLGPGALPLLKSFLKKGGGDVNPERRLRVRRLITELQTRIGGVYLEKALARKVSFEFVDTPLKEAAAFLKSLTKVPVEVDPALANIPINLRVTDMKAELALKWIAQLASAKVVKLGNKIKITKR